MQDSPAALPDPHQPTLTGIQLLAGLWFPAAWYPPAHRAAQLLDAWPRDQAGSRVYGFAEGELLLFPTPRPMDCGQCPGWPVIAVDTAVLPATASLGLSFGLSFSSSPHPPTPRYATAPLSPAEIAACQQRFPGSDLWRVEGNQILPLTLAEAKPVDPAEWIASAAVPLLEPYAFAPERPALAEGVVVNQRPLGEVLGKPELAPSPEQQAFRAGRVASPAAPPAAGEAAGESAWDSVSTGRLALAALRNLGAVMGGGIGQMTGLSRPTRPTRLGRLSQFLRKLFGTMTPPPETAGAPAGAGAPVPPRREPARPQPWRQLFARLAMQTGLARLVMGNQGRYLRDMFRRFEDDDLLEALRHALPLGGDGYGSLGQAFGTPSRRKDLALSRARRAGPSLNLDDDLTTRMRKTYRQAFERLDRAGKVDEAVYVLAELLAVRQEALDYLVKHGRLTQAAELALGWEMDADTIVRLHCMAEKWETALAVARRDNAFSSTLVLLEDQHPASARRLRGEWARSLMARGEWLQAVDTLWPLTDQRETALHWLRIAQAAGNELGIRARLRHLLLDPDALQDHREFFTQLRDDPSAEAARDRHLLAVSLLGTKAQTPSTQALARFLLPRLLADQAPGPGWLDKQQVDQLINLSQDKLLRTDFPARTLPLEKKGTPAAYMGSLPLPPAGRVAILDALPLPRTGGHGNYLLACGEAGVLLVNAQGKTLTRYPTPAHQLVGAPTGQVALALARRDTLWRVSRLDLVTHHIQDLGTLALDRFLPEFDGLSWTIVSDNTLRVLDTTEAPPRVTWQVELPGPVVACAQNPGNEVFLVRESPTQLSLWHYTLPQRRLAGRDLVELPPEEHPARDRYGFPDPASTASLVLVERQTPDPASPFTVTRITPGNAYAQRPFNLPSPHTPDRPDTPDTPAEQLPRDEALHWGEPCWAICRQQGTSRLITLFRPWDGRPRAHIPWAPDISPTLRATGQQDWLLFDQEGRLLHVDKDGRVAVVTVG